MSDIPIADVLWQAGIGAFVIWLIVRIIARRERWAIQLGIACVVLVALSAAAIVFFILIQGDR